MIDSLVARLGPVRLVEVEQLVVVGELAVELHAEDKLELDVTCLM